MPWTFQTPGLKRFLINQSKINPDSTVYSDTFRGYDVLDVSECRYVRFNRSEALVEDRNHINRIVELLEPGLTLSLAF